jgi:hypothetical protein
VYENRGGTVRWRGSGLARELLEIGSRCKKDTIYTERTEEYIANTGVSEFRAQKRTVF